MVAAKTVSKGISPTAQSVHHHNLRNAMAIALRPIDVQAFLSRCVQKMFYIYIFFVMINAILLTKYMNIFAI